MKAKIIETGEIIDVQRLYPVTYSRLDCNGKIIEEYDEDELEIIRTKPKVKLVDIEKVCNFLDGYSFIPTYVIKELRKVMEE